MFWNQSQTHKDGLFGFSSPKQIEQASLKQDDNGGETQLASSLEQEILASITFLDSTKDKNRVLSFYSNLDLSFLSLRSIKFSRSLLTLAFIGLSLFVMSVLFAFQWVPSFLVGFSYADVNETRMLLSLQNYWHFYFSGVIALLLWVGFVVMLAHKIRRLSLSTSYTWLLRCSFLPDIEKTYFKLQNLIWAPFLLTMFPKELHEGTDLENLSRLQTMGIDVTEQLQTLIDQEVRIIDELCQLQLKALIVLITCIIVGGVCFFFLGMFSPFVLSSLG